MSSLVLDTSGLYALLDRADPAHQRCATVAREFSALIVPTFTLIEVDYWCRKRGGGPESFALLISDIRAGAYALEGNEADIERAVELEVAYRDLDLGIVDAFVIAVCERLGEHQVLTLDRRDFSVVRPRHCAALQLLPD